MIFDFWLYDFKINRDYIFFNGYLCIKFDVCLLTSFKGIDLIIFNLMVNV